MGIWHRGSSAAPEKATHRQRRKARRKAALKQPLRRAEIERFEPRNLFAVAPQLITVIPNAGDFLSLIGTRPCDQEFREFTLRFDEGSASDALSAQNGGIKVFRSGDGVFGNGNDIDVTPLVSTKKGFIGIGDRPNEVVVPLFGPSARRSVPNPRGWRSASACATSRTCRSTTASIAPSDSSSTSDRKSPRWCRSRSAARRGCLRKHATRSRSISTTTTSIRLRRRIPSSIN